MKPPAGPRRTLCPIDIGLRHFDTVEASIGVVVAKIIGKAEPGNLGDRRGILNRRFPDFDSRGLGRRQVFRAALVVNKAVHAPKFESLKRLNEYNLVCGHAQGHHLRAGRAAHLNDLFAIRWSALGIQGQPRHAVPETLSFTLFKTQPHGNNSNPSASAASALERYSGYGMSVNARVGRRNRTQNGLSVYYGSKSAKPPKEGIFAQPLEKRPPKGPGSGMGSVGSCPPHLVVIA